MQRLIPALHLTRCLAPPNAAGECLCGAKRMPLGYNRAYGRTGPIYISVQGAAAHVPASIRETQRMLAAFRTFADGHASPEHLGELPDAVAPILERRFP